MTDLAAKYDLLRQMIRIRRFEEKCAELYSAQKIRGFLHLYIGEEAVAAGVLSKARESDSIVATYREHGHALVRGISARAVMAEMYGKTGGTCRGRGGSMHIFDAKKEFYGGNAIVGGGLPLAAGLALAYKMQKKDSVAICFFGEGAMAEGEFHESMNLAELWKLPVLFCCENNLYAMGTALERSESETDLCKKAQSYRVTAEKVDGMDALETAAAAEKFLARIRRTGEPAFIEFQTYRFRAQSMFDPELYRNKSEVIEWMKRDPITILKKNIGNKFDENRRRTIENETAAEIDDAVAFAEESPIEDTADLLRDVYTPREAVE